MFWKKARQRYGHLTEEDEDIKKYLSLSGEFQSDSYKGIIGYVQDLGHRWVAKRTSSQGPILEIGSGTGRHSLFFSGDSNNYFPSEYSARYLKSDVWEKYCGRLVHCDARGLPYFLNSFETVISIYNLEHISDIKSVLREVHRVLKPGGRFLIALPCEGGLLWNVGRELSTRRAFQKKYGIDYDKIIAWEHVWDFESLLQQIMICKLFHIEQLQMLPFRVRSLNVNLIACIEFSPKQHFDR